MTLQITSHDLTKITEKLSENSLTLPSKNLNKIYKDVLINRDVSMPVSTNQA